MSTRTFTSVMARLKRLTGANTDAELSRTLAVSPQTFSSWKIRDSIPYSICIDMAQQHACSLDWLLLGTAPSATQAEQSQSWEQEMLLQLRSLSADDRRAVAQLIEDKQRIRQLERQLSELASRVPDSR